MKTSNVGLALIKKYEGCRLTAYRCPAGVLTIGYGHTGADVKTGMAITKEKAEELLKKDLSRFEKNVVKYNDKYKWNQNQFDALVSFAFNIGSIDQLTAKGTRSIAQIAAAIPLYNKAGGRVLEGLTKRRKEEQTLFNKAVNKKVGSGGSNVGKKYKVTATALNCRDKAGMDGKVLGTFKKGETVELLKRDNADWYKVKGSKLVGHCCADYLKKV